MMLPMIPYRGAFTGTQDGMTDAQKSAMATAAVIENLDYWHHGDCIGADSDFHKIVRATSPKSRIIIHPPEDNSKRAFCEGDLILEPKPYLVRNQDMVDRCDILYACPGQMQEVLRSGTWSTVRRARKAKRLVVIVYPDGSVEIPPRLDQ